MTRSRTWILLADGQTAKLVRQLRPDRLTRKRMSDLIFEHEQKPLREIMSDRPGRSFSSMSAHRSAMEYASDPVRDEHREFARRLAAVLGQYRRRRSFDRLIIAAEPRMLGYLRDALEPEVAETVCDEIAKDFVKLPHEALIKAIAASTTVVT